MYRESHSELQRVEETHPLYPDEDDLEKVPCPESKTYKRTFQHVKDRIDLIRWVSVLFNAVLLAILVWVLSTKSRISTNKYAIAPQMAQHYQPFEYSNELPYHFKYFAFKREQRVLDSWEDLLSTSNLYFPPSEALKSGVLSAGQDIKRPVILPNGSYFGSVYVYHHLHCIRNLYVSLFRDEYEKEASRKTKWIEDDHLIHCLDWLRQAVMCNPDMTPLYYSWDDSQKVPGFEAVENHQCTNWQDVKSWSEKRMFDPFVRGLVTHPKYGYPYDDQAEGQS